MEKGYIIKLIKEYFNTPEGIMIDDPRRLNYISKVFKVYDVHLSNRALKHIVESRKGKDNMNLQNIICMFLNCAEVLSEPDIVFVNERSTFSIGLIKKNLLNSNNLIILEYSTYGSHYEMITMYQKDDKKIKKYVNIKHLIV